VEGNLESLLASEGTLELVNAIEMPVGNWDKYEYELGPEVIMLDWVLPGNVRYPADYGFVPSSTVSTDGEPLDVMVAAYDPVFPGCVVRGRVIGALDMTGQEGVEPNIFAVPDGDQRFDNIQTLDDMPEQNLREVENFFVAFKRLEGDEEAEVQGWRGLEETHELIHQNSRAYQEA
jgi:inorganic pyrophosphatase